MKRYNYAFHKGFIVPESVKVGKTMNNKKEPAEMLVLFSIPCIKINK